MTALFDSSYTLHGLTLALAWFFAVNAIACLIVGAIASRWVARNRTMSPGIWFGMRVLPALSAVTFVIAFFVPSYWMYEPIETNEAIDVTLAAFALASVGMLGAAAYRGVTAWRCAARRTRVWMGRARPLALPGTSMTAFEIDSDVAVMALAGVVRPRLLVTRSLVEALTPEELAASVAHEIGHAHARDNLKRLLMRAAPDLFFATRRARLVEQRWAAASEHRADRMAGGEQPAARCALASALVKVARLTISTPPIAEPISTLVGGGDIASRVRNLLDDAVPAGPLRRMRWTVVGVSAIVGIAAYAPLLQAVHHTTEALVYFLP